MKINSVSLEISAVRRSQYPNSEKPEFLLVGRSNVGKSSFINTIINRKNFARTSSKPGKTQTLNFYLVNDGFYLVDVPGYGFAMVNKKLKQKFGMMIEEYLETRENLKKVFMLVDFRHKPTEDDILMYNFLKYYNNDVTVIAMKTDKVKKTNHEKNKNIILKTLKIENSNDLILFSAVTKMGRQEIYNILDNILDE